MSRCYSQPWNYYSYASIALLKRMSSWMSRLIFNAAFKYLWGIFIALLNWRRSGTSFERTNATRSPSIPFVLPHVSCGWDEGRFERVDDFVGEETPRERTKRRNYSNSLQFLSRRETSCLHFSLVLHARRSTNYWGFCQPIYFVDIDFPRISGHENLIAFGRFSNQRFEM